jgi:chromosomal replication initiator protein
MDRKAIWEGVLSRLSLSVSRAHILSFLKDSVILECEDGVITIGVPTLIAFNFIKERLYVKILDCVRELVQDVKEIKFQIKGSLLDEDHPDKADLNVIQGLEQKKAARKAPNKMELIMEGGVRSKMFNPAYSLHNFIAGEENRLVHAACMAVAAKPGNIYNPLYIYGGVGLGKTHLLQATGREIMRNHPEKNVVYMTSERFINEIIEAIGKKHTRSFKDKYRNVDCLIVDDIQFFGNKASSQQEFFHTFNELYDSGRQIILSSDRPPRELDELEERLASRFGMGMVVEVTVPEFETRIAILNAKCAEHQVLIDREVIEFIAYNVTSSIRELEGVLISAIAEAQLTQTTPTIRSVAEYIKRLNKGKEIEGIDFNDTKKITVRTVDDVIDIVSSYYKITKSELTGEDRRKEFNIPRQVCMFLIRHILSQSYETIGEFFNGRNHTTVLHACNKVISQMKQDQRLQRDLNAIKKEMGV